MLPYLTPRNVRSDLNQSMSSEIGQACLRGTNVRTTDRKAVEARGTVSSSRLTDIKA